MIAKIEITKAKNLTILLWDLKLKPKAIGPAMRIVIKINEAKTARDCIEVV